MTADSDAAVAAAPRPRPLPFAWDRVALPAFILLMGLVFGSPVRAPAGWKPK